MARDGKAAPGRYARLISRGVRQGFDACSSILPGRAPPWYSSESSRRIMVLVLPAREPTIAPTARTGHGPNDPPGGRRRRPAPLRQPARPDGPARPAAAPADAADAVGSFPRRVRLMAGARRR